MLDQNTDRMWYVIGAVLIGAAIIFGMNTLMPSAFASISDNFTNVLDDMAYSGPIDLKVDVGSRNYNNTIDIKVFSDSEHGIADIEILDGPDIVDSDTILSFDGKESYLDMRYNFDLATSFTVGGWVNDVSNSNFLVNHDTGGGWSLASNGGIKTAEGGSKWLGTEASHPNTLGDNSTNHVVQTWDGDTITYYINGEKVSEIDGISGTFELESLFIGARSNLLREPVREPTRRASGNVLEFFMFKNNALTEAEVQESFNNGLATSNGLVLHYDFVNGSGDTVVDQSPTQNHATNYGGKWIPMFRVSENGTYTFRVTDNDGNIRDKEVSVRGIR